MPRRPRNRSVQAQDSTVLHSIAGLWERARLENGGELSEKQEWYWDLIIAELEWRSARERKAGHLGCVCRFCVSPFPS